MLFRVHVCLDETHRVEETAAKQVYTFPEPGSHLIRIKNVNGSVEEDL
jgi:hypothetical protein